MAIDGRQDLNVLVLVTDTRAEGERSKKDLRNMEESIDIVPVVLYDYMAA